MYLETGYEQTRYIGAGKSNEILSDYRIELNCKALQKRKWQIRCLFGEGRQKMQQHNFDIHSIRNLEKVIESV